MSGAKRKTAAMAARINDNALRFPCLEFPSTNEAAEEEKKLADARHAKEQGGEHLSLPAIVALVEQIREDVREPAVRPVHEVHLTKLSKAPLLEDGMDHGMDTRSSILGAVDFLRAQDQALHRELQEERMKIKKRRDEVEEMERRRKNGKKGEVISRRDSRFETL